MSHLKGGYVISLLWKQVCLLTRFLVTLQVGNPKKYPKTVAVVPAAGDVRCESPA